MNYCHRTITDLYVWNVVGRQNILHFGQLESNVLVLNSPSMLLVELSRERVVMHGVTMFD